MPPDGDCVPPWEDLPEAYFAADPQAQAAPDRPQPGPAPEPPRASGAASEAVSAPAESAAMPAALSRDSVGAARAVLPGGAMSGGLPDWHGMIREAGLGGLVRELAQHCELVAFQADQVGLRLGSTHRHLLQVNRSASDKLQRELGRHLGREIRLAIEVGEIAGETPAQRDQQVRAEQHAAAVASLERDPFVQELIERFDATLLESSVKPLRTLQVESNP